MKATVPGVGVRLPTLPAPPEELLDELLEDPLDELPEELLPELPDELPEELLEEAPEELPEELDAAAASLPEPPPQAVSNSADTSSANAAEQRKFRPDMINPIELNENPEQRHPGEGAQA